MMQIVKPAKDPRSDMILSNDGTKTETMMIEMGSAIRIVSLAMPRVRPDMPVRDSEAGRARASSPQTISSVLTIGRVLSR